MDDTQQSDQPTPTDPENTGAPNKPPRKLRPYEMPGQEDMREYHPDPQSTIDYLRSIAPRKKKHTGRKVLIAALILVGIAALGGGAYWLVQRPAPQQPKSASSTTTPAQNKGITKATKHHLSPTFSLEFDYPEDWSVNETEGSGQLIVRSPRLKLKNPAGQTVPGQIVLTIRDKKQALTEFNDGDALAAIASEKLDYAKPSSVQRGSTYISFLRYEGTSSQKALDGIYVSGDNGYQEGQIIPKTDFDPVDPIISLTFVTCANQQCTGDKSGTPMSVASSIWQDPAFGKPLKALFASIVVSS